MDYPDDVECPDWCVGTARSERRAGGHFTEFTHVTGLDERQEIQVRGVRGWYDGEGDFVEAHITGVDGRTTVLKLDAAEWHVTSTLIDHIITIVA